MSRKRPLKSIPLSDAEEDKLMSIAADIGSYALTGPTVGMPSWRRMVAEIASGEITVRRRSRPSSPPPAVPAPAPESVDTVDTGLPLWWPRDETGGLAIYVPADGPLGAHCNELGLTLTEWGYEARNEWIAASD